VTDSHAARRRHDLTLKPVGKGPNIVNFMCEIPKYSTAKLEVQKTLPHNPIMQDTKKGARHDDAQVAHIAGCRLTPRIR